MNIVVDYDDFFDENNGLNFLFKWKARFTKFKVNLFVVPGKTSKNMLELMERNKDWLQLCVHGFLHENNYECQYWDENKINSVLNYVEETGYYQKVWRCPGWQITYPQPYNEKPDINKPINSNPQLIYNVLKERGYLICDQHYNRFNRPEKLKIYCTCNPYFIHGHIQNIDSGEPNGLEQIEKAGVPWDSETNFKFISELTDEELKCQY